jgi:hypothetical protein
MVHSSNLAFGISFYDTDIHIGDSFSDLIVSEISQNSPDDGRWMTAEI